MRTLRQELNEKFVQVYFLSKSISIYEKEVNSLQELLAGMKLQQEKGKYLIDGNVSFGIYAIFAEEREERTGKTSC